MAAPLQRFSPIAELAVFRALNLGDMLCAVPSLRALRRALPRARITLVGLPWATEFAHRFRRYVDDFIAFPGHPDLPERCAQMELLPKFFHSMQEKRFDLALQMHGDGRVSNQVVVAFGARASAGWRSASSRLHLDLSIPYQDRGAEPLRLLSLLEALGIGSAGENLEFPITTGDVLELDAQDWAASLVPGRYICIHPGARNWANRWPAEDFAAVADALIEATGLSIALTGSAAEADLTSAVALRMRHQAVDTASPLSIGAMAALMSRSRLLICNDTGVSHIAAGLRLPSVVIFHHADMERWAPLDRERHRCLRDPAGKRMKEVLDLALAQLSGG